MAAYEFTPDLSRSGLYLRILCVAGTLAILVAAHWWSPVETHQWHAVHVLLRKTFFLPIVLAAIWFGLRGALIAAAAATAVYVPYVIVQWYGQAGENVNQYAEITGFWLTAGLAGALVQSEKRALRQIAAANEDALIALVNALDAREHDTELHSLRVREYSVRLGKELGMKTRDLRTLSKAALLHDIGKIGISDAILLKPGALTDSERNRMEEHPAIGRRILAMIESVRDAAEIVYAHHEHVDGSGYPRGLRGNQIPFGARVFAVVDAFDAIVSKRPYEEAVTFEQACERLQSASGTHFDPEVVRAFLKIPKEEWTELARDVESVCSPACMIRHTDFRTQGEMEGCS